MFESTVKPQTEAVIGLDQREKPIRVLHVDDDASFLKLARHALQTEGRFQVETALSVQEALQKMKEAKFDVIVSDYVMPDKDGLTFLKELREKGENIPFIIFTGKGKEEVAKEALNLGADRYLNKTGDPEIVYCELAHSITKAVKTREAEKALRDSEEKFRAISESAGDATVSIDTQGRIVFWNRVAETIFGYSADEMIGKPVTFIMPERCRDNHKRKFGEWLSSQPPPFGKTFEMVGLKRDGKEFPLEASFSMWKMKGETFLTIVARDVTGQKKAWDALKRAEEEAKNTLSLLSATLESTADGILVVKTDGKIAIFNRRFVEMWHIPDEIIATRDSDRVLKSVLDQLKEPEEFLKKTGELHRQPETEGCDLLEFKDGRVFEQYSRPQRIVGAAVAGRVWSFRDVTEDKKAEKEVQENKQKFEGLFMGNPEAAVYLSQDFHILDMNPRFFELFGYPLEEVKGKDINDVVVPPERTEEGHMLDQSAARGYVYFDTFRKRKDGSLIAVSVSAAPIIVGGKLVGHMAMYKDISELKGTEAAMREMMQKLATMNEKLRVVGSLTRHDVRNKLSIVTGNIFLAKRRIPDNPVVSDYLHEMDSACQQILKIFDFAHSYEMLGDEELKNVDVGETVEKAISLFSDLKDVKVSNECQGLKVLADSLLERLFYNMIDNSLKYGEKITQIRVYYEKSDKNLKLLYQDDGIGIPSAEKPKLFKEGYGKGTGYGLYLIKKMMEVYGWTIKETGEPGEGAQFTITIPETNENGKENYQID